jgi:hypothetical protein
MSADWNSDSSKIVYTQHDALCIKSLKANVKPIRVGYRYVRPSGGTTDRWARGYDLFRGPIIVP